MISDLGELLVQSVGNKKEEIPFFFAEVTGLAPLFLKFEGEDEPIEVGRTPSLDPTLAVGDVIYLHRNRKRLVILGKSTLVS